MLVHVPGRNMLLINTAYISQKIFWVIRRIQMPDMSKRVLLSLPHPYYTCLPTYFTHLVTTEGTACHIIPLDPHLKSSWHPWQVPVVEGSWTHCQLQAGMD